MDPNEDDIFTEFSLEGFDYGEVPEEFHSQDEVYDPSVAPETKAKEIPKSKTALSLDHWSERKGRHWRNTKEGKKATRDYDKIENPDHIAADLLAAAWEPRPKLAGSYENEDIAKRAKFLEALFDSPEYKKLHRSTTLDMLASEIAAASFSKSYVTYRLKETPDNELDDKIETNAAADDAAEQANKEVQNLNDARESLGDGIGSQDGHGKKFSVSQVREMFKRIKNDPMLRNIMELSGRWRRLAKSMQANKPVHGQDEYLGVELGDNLFRLCPSELVSLAHGDENLELDFFRRLVEKQLMNYEVRAKAGESAGPVVILVDESGSMSGSKINQAKAMALAMSWVAEHQNRWCCLAGFSSYGYQNRLVIEPGKKDQEKMLDWLGKFRSGGTDAKEPFENIPRDWEKIGCPKGKTDFIIITDGWISFDSDQKGKFNTWREEHQVRTKGIVIGDGGEAIKPCIDDLFEINDLSMSSEGIQQCLSI